jgi:hypothetical protein
MERSNKFTVGLTERNLNTQNQLLKKELAHRHSLCICSPFGMPVIIPSFNLKKTPIIFTATVGEFTMNRNHCPDSPTGLSVVTTEI